MSIGSKGIRALDNVHRNGGCWWCLMGDGLCFNIIVMVHFGMRCVRAIRLANIESISDPVNPMVPLAPQLISWHYPGTQSPPKSSVCGASNNSTSPFPLGPCPRTGASLMNMVPSTVCIDRIFCPIIHASFNVGSSSIGNIRHGDHSQVHTAVVDKLDLAWFESIGLQNNIHYIGVTLTLKRRDHGIIQFH